MSRKTILSETASHVLQHLRSSRSRKTVDRTARDMGMSYETMCAALEEIPSRMIIRVRGQVGFVMAA